MAWLGGIAAGICAGGVIYQWLGALLGTRWLAERPAASSEPLPPVTLLRPLKAGVPGLAEKLDQLAQAMGPGDQLVLGAAVDSMELAQCAAVQAAYSERDIVVVPCREGAARNPKISKLGQMDAACRHERLILSDSEAVIDAVWLAALRREWQGHEGAVLTTPYRFIGMKTWPQRLDAAAVLLGLWPGLAIVRRWGRVDFTLGACTALRRRDLAAVGGWAAFGDFLAEDRQLGKALAARGQTIRLAATVTTLECDALSWRDWWRHQCRVATTYRVASPAGFAGTILTHSSAAALLLALMPGSGTARVWFMGWAGLSVALRWLAAKRLEKMARFGVPGLLGCVVVAGWMETVGWVLSWVVKGVWWSGRRWQLSPDGKLGMRPDKAVG